MKTVAPATLIKVQKSNEEEKAEKEEKIIKSSGKLEEFDNSDLNSPT